MKTHQLLITLSIFSNTIFHLHAINSTHIAYGLGFSNIVTGIYALQQKQTVTKQLNTITELTQQINAYDHGLVEKERDATLLIQAKEQLQAIQAEHATALHIINNQSTYLSPLIEHWYTICINNHTSAQSLHESIKTQAKKLRLTEIQLKNARILWANDNVHEQHLQQINIIIPEFEPFIASFNLITETIDTYYPYLHLMLTTTQLFQTRAAELSPLLNNEQTQHLSTALTSAEKKINQVASITPHITYINELVSDIKRLENALLPILSKNYTHLDHGIIMQAQKSLALLKDIVYTISQSALYAEEKKQLIHIKNAEEKHAVHIQKQQAEIAMAKERHQAALQNEKTMSQAALLKEKNHAQELENKRVQLQLEQERINNNHYINAAVATCNTTWKKKIAMLEKKILKREAEIAAQATERRLIEEQYNKLSDGLRAINITIQTMTETNSIDALTEYIALLQAQILSLNV